MKLRKTVTVDEVMAFDPWGEWSREKVEEVFSGRKRMDLAAIKVVPEGVLSWDEKLWVILRDEFITERNLHLLGCHFVERAFRGEQARGHKIEPCYRKAIRIKRRWARGELSNRELVGVVIQVKQDAWPLCRAVMWAVHPALEGVWWVAEYSATSAPNRAAEQRWQFEFTCDVIEGRRVLK